jgi:TRAP-type C4-dicarboxylate transport system permease small subunit
MIVQDKDVRGANKGGFALLRPLELALEIVLAILLFGMMWITLIDVIGRYVFNAPLPAAYELTELSMGILVFTGLPLGTARQEHITVTILSLPVNFRRIQSVFVSLLGAVVVGFFAWRLWEIGKQLRGYGETTLHLKIWVAPFAFYMSLMTAIAALILLMMAWHHLRWRIEEPLSSRRI